MVLLPLHCTNQYVKDSNNNTVVLKGVNFPCSGDNWFWRKGDHAPASDFAAVSGWGANVIRLSIETTGGEWLDPDDYIYSADNSLDLDDIVYLAQINNLYIILDMHYYEGAGPGDFPAVPADWIATWEEIADHYKNSSNVLFELQNEPGGITFNQWKGYAQDCYDAIRAIADNIILVDGWDWSNELTSWDGNWLQDLEREGYADNVIYTTHYYVSGYGHDPPSSRPDLDDFFDEDLGWKAPLDGGIAPLLVGEFNLQNGDHRDPDYDGATKLATFDLYMDVLDDWGASYTPWCYIAGPDTDVGWNHEYLFYNAYDEPADNLELFFDHLVPPATKGFTFDAMLQATRTKTFSLDAYLQWAKTKTFTLDGYLQEAHTKTFSLDALLEGTLTKTFSLDSWLQQEQHPTFDFNACLKAVGTPTFSFDAELFAEELTKTFTFDGLLQKGKVNFTFDGFLQEIAVTLQRLGLLEEIIRRMEQENFGKVFAPGTCTPGLDNYGSPLREVIRKLEKK